MLGDSLFFCGRVGCHLELVGLRFCHSLVLHARPAICAGLVLSLLWWWAGMFGAESEDAMSSNTKSRAMPIQLPTLFLFILILSCLSSISSSHVTSSSLLPPHGIFPIRPYRLFSSSSLRWMPDSPLLSSFPMFSRQWSAFD